MQITLIGINHKSAPVAIREKLAFDTAGVRQALTALKADYPLCEFVLLSTCNRVECCAAIDTASGPAPAELARRLVEFQDGDFDSIQEYLYIKTDEDVATHLFTVAAALDSMVIGESQITAQVKESFKLAAACGSTGKVLNHLYHDAFRTTKDIVTQTSIAERRVSVAGVAVELAKQLFQNIQSAAVLVIGAGQMGQLLIEHFSHEKCKHITVVNRSEQRRCQIAKKHPVTVKPWQSMDDEVVRANIIVGAATAHEGYVFSKERIKSLMALRRNRALLIVDITVPRCFDPEISRIENVYLYSIDDLARVARDNIQLREGDLEKSIEIIHGSVSAFMDWFLTRDVGPLIGKVKAAFGQIGQIEMNKFFTGTRQNADCKNQMDASLRRIVNKLCHCIINNIDLISKERGSEEAEKFTENIVANAHKILNDEIQRKAENEASN